MRYLSVLFLWLISSFQLYECTGKYLLVDRKLDTVSKAVGVAGEAMDLATKLDGILTAKLDAHYNRVAQPPAKLIGPDAVGEIAKNMKSGTKIQFKEMPGFSGVDQYQLPGWKITSSGAATKEKQPAAEKEQVYTYAMGVGPLLMSGCFGSGYTSSDPCYKVAPPAARCGNQIDAAKFIGVGFNVIESYTSESRRKSCVQRTCANKADFLDKDVPDNMNAFGIYDYKIGTKSFQSVDGYRAYLAEKSGVSMTARTFAQVSRKFQSTSSMGVSTLISDVGVSHGRYNYFINESTLWPTYSDHYYRYYVNHSDSLGERIYLSVYGKNDKYCTRIVRTSVTNNEVNVAKCASFGHTNSYSLSECVCV